MLWSTLSKPMALALAVALPLAAPVDAASLLGDEIDITLTGGIALEDLSVLVGSGVEIQGGDMSTNFGSFLFASESIDIGADTIDMQFDTSLGADANLTFGDLDFGLGIASATLVSTIPEVTQSDVTTTPTSVTIDASDWFAVGGVATLNLTLTEVQMEVIPLPATGALLLLGIGVACVARGRRKVA